ncbi:MAG TPA: hypothetical protein VK206_23435, partial [Anaerolineales bacterium]|nr:hypothetical protein [Anaerolineales bacterium]
GSATDDTVYTTIEDKLGSLTDQRNAIAGKMRAFLENATFNGQTISNNKAQALIKQAQTVLDKMHALATAP